PFSFGVEGGLAVPTSTLGNDLNSGYSVGGLLDLHPAPGPLSLRLEVGYDRFDYKATYETLAAQQIGVNYSSNTHFLRGTANLVYRLPNMSGIRPYITGGVGVYNNSHGSTLQYAGYTSSSSSTSTTKFGINGGVGVELPLSGITPFIEVRAHGVQTDYTPVTYVPITVGFRF
ncbi:MAG TPA: outer membrane beta-barrel protein, partial [Gemmatirosa sp.]